MSVPTLIRSRATISATVPSLTHGRWTASARPNGVTYISSGTFRGEPLGDIATLFGEPADQAVRAKRIVTAVNAHQSLVDALRDAEGWLDSIGQHYKIQAVIDAAARTRAVIDGVQS